MRRFFTVLLVIVLCLGLSSCERKAFRKAARADTVEAYREYLAEYPEGDFAERAEKRIEELIFRKAVAARSIKDMRDYLEEYPDSKYTDEVRLVIRNMLRGTVAHLSDEDLKDAELLVKTGMGDFRIKLFPTAAPENVRNLILLAASDFYKGLEVDMVRKGQMILIGDLIGDNLGGPGYFVPFEKNDKKHRRSTVSIYHLPVDKDTGGSQFFISLKALPNLDGRFTVVGEVVEGMETVDKISKVETTQGKRGPFKPQKPIEIKDVVVEGIDLISLTEEGTKNVNQDLSDTGGGR